MPRSLAGATRAHDAKGIDMLAPIGPTLETTYALQIRQRDGSWQFMSAAEYTTAEGCHEEARVVYGGAFAAPDRHRVIKIERMIMD